MSKHTEVFEDVKVTYDNETQYLYIDDRDTGEQLAIFCVIDRD